MDQELRIRNIIVRGSLPVGRQGEAIRKLLPLKTSRLTHLVRFLEEYKKSSQKGITLIELLLYMGIFSILLGVLVQLFGTIVNVSLESQANSSVSQDGRYILSRITYDVRQADVTKITSPAVYGVQNPAIQVLQFTTIDGTIYKYWMSGNNLMLDNLTVIPNTSYQVNSYGTSVSNLSFTRMKSTTTTSTPKNIITVSFTLTSTTIESGNRQRVGNFQTTIGTR